MEIFNIIDLSVFYEKRFDGGGTTFGFNAITKSDIINKIQDQGDVLEICSGPGFIGYTLLKYNKANRLVLSDINPEVRDGIETTNRFNNLKVEFIQSDCFDLM
jgi:methylase of polypeptide subunit release factors